MGVVQAVPKIENNSSEDEISIEELINSITDPISEDKSKIFINCLDKDNYNIFHKAIIAGNKELVLDFIKRGADLNILSGDDKTPLELALYHKENEIATIIWNELKFQMNFSIPERENAQYLFKLEHVKKTAQILKEMLNMGLSMWL